MYLRKSIVIEIQLLPVQFYNYNKNSYCKISIKHNILEKFRINIHGSLVRLGTIITFDVFVFHGTS